MERKLKDLLIDELQDLLSSENQIVKAMPKMVRAAHSPDLKKAFEFHLNESRGQLRRLEKIFKLLGTKAEQKFCKGTKGLIQECEEILKDFKVKSPLRDAALISKAQRIEHYEISAYGTARAFASEIDHSEIADLLQETLDEEGSANKKLSKLAEGGLLSSGINHQANLSGAKNSKEAQKELAKPRNLKSRKSLKPETKSLSSSLKSIKPKSSSSKPKTMNSKPKKIKAFAGKH
jgi:ferritin-like metal-binding protein YciE